MRVICSLKQQCALYLPSGAGVVYRAGVMSKADPKGYYACLGVEPWATPTKSGQRITAPLSSVIQTSTRALRQKPAFKPSTKPTGSLEIQTKGPLTTTRGGLLQVKTMKPDWTLFAGGGPSSMPVRAHPTAESWLSLSVLERSGLPCWRS